MNIVKQQRGAVVTPHAVCYNLKVRYIRTIARNLRKNTTLFYYFTLIFVQKQHFILLNFNR